MIKRVEVRNFRSLRDVNVDLSPLTVLIGRSGSGKTNFVHAFRLLVAQLQAATNPRALQEFDAAIGDWSRASCATIPPHNWRVVLAFAFELPRSGRHCRYQVTLDENRRAIQESLSEAGKDLFAVDETANGIGWTRPPNLRPLPQPDGAAMLGRLSGIPAAHLAFLALSKGIACYDFSNTVLWDVNPGPVHATTLWGTGGNAVAVYDAITNNLSSLDAAGEILSAIRQINKNVVSISLTPDTSSLVVGHQFGDTPILTFPLRQESEGFRRFLAHQIALHQQPPKQTLVFEEPEKGLYPGALAALADSFKAAAARGTQVILVTHSPELLKHFSADQIRVVEMHNHETRIGPLAEEQRQALIEELLRPDELLSVDPARLDPSTAS